MVSGCVFWQNRSRDPLGFMVNYRPGHELRQGRQQPTWGQRARGQLLECMADGTPGRFCRVKSWTQKRLLITHFSLVEVFKICCPTWHFPKVPHRFGMLLPVHGQTKSFSQHTPKGPSPRPGPQSL